MQADAPSDFGFVSVLVSFSKSSTRKIRTQRQSSSTKMSSPSSTTSRRTTSLSIAGSRHLAAKLGARTSKSFGTISAIRARPSSDCRATTRDSSLLMRSLMMTIPTSRPPAGVLRVCRASEAAVRLRRALSVRRRHRAFPAWAPLAGVPRVCRASEAAARLCRALSRRRRSRKTKASSPSRTPRPLRSSASVSAKSYCAHFALKRSATRLICHVTTLLPALSVLRSGKRSAPFAVSL